MNSDSISDKSKEIFEDIAMVLNGHIQNCEKKGRKIHELQLAQIASISNLLSICIANFCVTFGHDLQEMLKDIIPIINRMSFDQHQEKKGLLDQLKAIAKESKDDPESALLKIKELFDFTHGTSSVH